MHFDRGMELYPVPRFKLQKREFGLPPFASKRIFRLTTEKKEKTLLIIKNYSDVTYYYTK